MITSIHAIWTVITLYEYYTSRDIVLSNSEHQSTFSVCSFVKASMRVRCQHRTSQFNNTVELLNTQLLTTEQKYLVHWKIIVFVLCIGVITRIKQPAAFMLMA